MSFLAPWLLAAGLGAIALPILFHLFRRTPRGRMPFSTLMFLSPSPPRVTRRSRLENWPLLLMRAAVLALLALAFGRPLWRQLLESQTEPSAGVRTVLLIDTSASMRRGDAWDRALAETQKVADAAGPNDELTLVAFDSAVRTLLPAKEWRAAPADQRAALMRAALSTLTPSWGGTRLDRGLIEAAELLESSDDLGKTDGRAEAAVDRSKQAKRIVLVTDLQSGARIAGLEGYEWPKQVEVQVIATAVRTANAGVHPLEIGDDSKESGVRPRVMLVNAADSSRESFHLAWKTKPAAAVPTPSPTVPATATPTATPSATPTTTPAAIASATPTATAAAVQSTAEAYVPPGKTRIVRAPPIPPGDFAELVLSGDEETFDNGLWFVPPTRDQVRVLHLAREPRDDAQTLRYFLERALADDAAGRHVSVETIDPSAAGVRVPTERDFDDVGLVVLALDDRMPEAWTAALSTWVESGGAVVAVIQRAEASPSASTPWRSLLPTELTDPKHVEVKEADTKVEFALLSQIDLRHPLFAPLNDPRFSDFTKIRFWRHRQLTLDAAAKEKLRVLARFDGGMPAIVEAPRGKGRVFLLASGWQPRESQLGVSSKFVPLVLTFIDLGRRRAAITAQVEIGDEVELPSAGTTDAAAAKWTVRTPAGRESALAAGSTRFMPDEGPGVYELRSRDYVHCAAVNVPADESKTAPLGPEVLEAVGVRLSKETPEQTPELAAERRTLQLAEMEARQQLWRPLLAAAIGLAIAETWVAGRSAGREQLAAAAPEGSK